VYVSTYCILAPTVKTSIVNFPPGAHFRKYVGHSAHVTNIRFNHDHTKVITTGGADQSIFQWRFHPDGFRDGDGGLPEAATGYVDSDDGQSDSDASDVGELDSDVENVSILQFHSQSYHTIPTSLYHTVPCYATSYKTCKSLNVLEFENKSSRP
jgi:hypothetical protein